MGEIKLNDFDEFSYEVNYIDSFDNYDFSFFDYINIISIEKNIQFDIYFNKFLIDKNYKHIVAFLFIMALFIWVGLNVIMLMIL